MLDGFLVVDKPAGMTSHDVVAILRRTLQQKKIGHTGTLDPFATGVLPIALGEGTKAIPYLDESFKEYRAVMRLGISTDTLDYTGRVLLERDWQQLTPEAVAAVLPQFTGTISQVPPMYSALKQGGVPLYKLARKGESVTREPRRVEIASLVLESIELPRVTFTVRCSKGTYVRSLAEDIGEALGVGAHLCELRRLASGSFDLARARSLEEIAASVPNLAGSLLITLREALAQLPECTITATAHGRLRNGIAPALADLEHGVGNLPAAGLVKVLYNGQLAALCTVVPSQPAGLRIERVFNQFCSLQ